MAAKGNFLTTYRGKRVLGFVYGWGAAIVLVGAWAKILHLSFADIMLTIGLLTEAAIFFISAFEPPHVEPDWARVYPELDDDALEGSGGGKESMTRKLDDMLEEANIERNMLNRLGENLGKLSDNVSKMGEMTDAAASTGEFTKNARDAANTLGQLKDAYAGAISSAEGISTSLESMKGISESTAKVQGEMATLQENLSGLNRVYGNMLTAIKS